MTEEDVKKAIRSLLTSTPNVLNVRTVQKDYKELMGTDVPYQQFGYNSLEQFLKCIPDVCLVQGGGQWATVIPIVNEKVAHINNMVMKQRNNSRKSAGTRRPKQANFQHKQPMNFSPHTTDSSKGSNLIFHNTQANPYQAPPSKQVDNPHSEVPQKSVKNTPPLISKNPFDNSQLPVETRVDGGSIAEVKADVRHSLLNGLPTKRKQHLLNLNPLPKQAETVHNQYRSSTSAAHSPPFDNAPVLENENDYFFTSKNLDIFKPYLNSAAKLQEATEEVAVCVPQRVQNNLKTLISRFNEGIWCSQLPEEYRKAFRRDLVYYDYGFTSLIEMCIALNDIFHYVRPGQDDFKLYDRNNPLPDNIERNFTMASYQLDPKGGAQTSGKPLPSLVWSDFARRLPADIVSLGEEIPKQFLPTETKVGDVFDVVVLEVYDPSKFWFYLGKSDKKAPLDLLMDDMQEFYKGENISQYCVPPALVQEGLYCVQRILGEYHRAKIVRVPPHAQDQVRLLYIDYGTVASESVTGMCFLHRRFANLPAQAIRCRLANVKPVNVGPWPRPVSDYVRDVLNGSNTKLKVTFIDWHDEYVCGFLADVTNTDRIVYVNELLVRKGHAKWETEAQESPFMLPNYKCKVNRLHLFPSFLELEYGLAPNASEMYMLEEMLVPINFCIPQYFELVDTLDDDEAIEARENSFADTIKTHRKTLPYGCKESRAALGCPDFDFDVFDELKEDIVAFIEGLSSEERSKFRNVECCNEWYECVEEAVVDEAAGEIVRQDVDLSENILKQLETYELPADLVFDEQKVSYMADPVAVRQTEIDDLERELSMLLDDDFVERRKDDEEKVPEIAARSNPFNNAEAGSYRTPDLSLSLDEHRVSSDDDAEEAESRGTRMQRCLNNIKSVEPQEVGVDAETPMEKTRAEFVSSLNANNPFRAYLEGELGRGDHHIASAGNSIVAPSTLSGSARSVMLSATSEPFVPRAAATTSTQTSEDNAMQTFQPFTPLVVDPRWPYDSQPMYSQWSEPANFQMRARPPPGFDVVRSQFPDPRVCHTNYDTQYVTNMNFAFGMMNQAAQFRRYPDFYDRNNPGPGRPW